MHVIKNFLFVDLKSTDIRHDDSDKHRSSRVSIVDLTVFYKLVQYY